MGAREDLDEARLAGAVVAEDTRDLTRVDVHGDVIERDDVAVVLRHAVGLEQVRRGVHRVFPARARTNVLSMTAAKRIPPWNVKVQLLSHCASMIPSWTMPSIAAPNKVPITEPKPPVRRQPPTTAQMMKMNSRPMPSFACIDLSSRASMIPISAATPDVIMNSAIFVCATGTPTLRAAFGSPPAL